jgi:hypothetical protein
MTLLEAKDLRCYVAVERVLGQKRVLFIDKYKLQYGNDAGILVCHTRLVSLSVGFGIRYASVVHEDLMVLSRMQGVKQVGHRRKGFFQAHGSKLEVSYAISLLWGLQVSLRRFSIRHSSPL